MNEVVLSPTFSHDRSVYSSMDWNPSPEQKEAFMEREVVLAAANIKRLWQKGFRKIAPDDLLCSTTTLSAAIRSLSAQGYSP